MSEPRRSTRARAREEATAVPETPKETPTRAKSTLKRKRASVAAKDSTPGTPNADAALHGPRHNLPFKFHDGQPLPTLPEPQPLNLPSSEWQDIQHSGVLNASLERSRAVWVSGANFRVFHKNFTQPKKPGDRTDEDRARHLRQKDIEKTYVELGKEPTAKLSVKEQIEIQAQLVIEPHTFPIRLYASREGLKMAAKKTSTPASTYGAWPNHNQPQHSQPNQYTQYNHGSPAYPPKLPQPRPPPPKPVQKAPPPPPAPTSTPAPDPVIHMLAARAGTDPELKAVMKIVAAGHASKDQLEFFQTHINELTAILAKQKEDAAKAQRALALPPAPKPLPPPPAPKALPQPSTPQPSAPAPRPVQPAQPLQHTLKPYSPVLPQFPHLQHTPSTRPPPAQYLNHSQPQTPYRQTPQMSSYDSSQPQPYRPLVFSFEEGNKDMLYFPSYSFMEELPNKSGAKFSFLITKMKPKAEPIAKPPSTPAPQVMTPFTFNGNTAISTPNTDTSSVPPPLAPTPRIEDFDESSDIADVNFYQPVTVLLLTDNKEVYDALGRAIRPPAVVESYMDEVFDRCKRAEETFLAFRLPRDGDADVAEKRVRSGDGTPVVATPIHDMGFGLGMTLAGGMEKKKAGRPRKSLT
jgi:hypothetical protein